MIISKLIPSPAKQLQKSILAYRFGKTKEIGAPTPELVDHFHKFDQKMKEKYLNNRYQDQQYAYTDPKFVKAQIEEEYKKFQQENIEKNEEGKQFTRSLFKEEVDQKELDDQKNYSEMMKKYFKDFSDPEYTIKKTQELRTYISQNQHPDIEKLDAEYTPGNYSHFDKISAKIKDIKNTEKEEDMLKEQSAYTGYHIYQFLKKNTSVQDSKRVEASLFSRNFDPRKKLQNQALESEEEIFKVYQSHITWLNDYKPKQRFEDDFEEFNQQPANPMGSGMRRLSPRAKLEIYMLYKEGWPIKDISDRFGILPDRIKFEIWCFGKFFHEIIPRFGLKPLLLEKLIEQSYLDRGNSYQDYGLDLQALSEYDSGVVVPAFNKVKEVDIYQNRNLTDSEKATLKQRINKKYDQITIGFVGEGNKGYILKDLIAYKQKGLVKVNKMFKKILKYSDQPDKLPKRVREKLSKGPRAASLGYGFK